MVRFLKDQAGWFVLEDFQLICCVMGIGQIGSLLLFYWLLSRFDNIHIYVRVMITLTRLFVIKDRLYPKGIN